MSIYLIEITKIGYYIMFSVFLGVLIIILSYLFSIANADSEKVSAYECGFDPYEDARNAFNVRYYLVAILFIIFDLEAAFFFPWCVSSSCLNVSQYWGVLDFLVELLIGYGYVYSIGVLDWD